MTRAKKWSSPKNDILREILNRVNKGFGSLFFVLVLCGLRVFAREEIRKDDIKEGAESECHAECFCLSEWKKVRG